MSLKEITSQIQAKLDKKLPSHAFLRKVRLLAEIDRHSSAYTDPSYLPAYYWLGRFLRSTNLLEIGFRLGLNSRTYLSARPGTQRLVAFQDKGEDFYSPKLGKANVRDYFRGELEVYLGDWEDGGWQGLLRGTTYDLVLVNDEYGYDRLRGCLDEVWKQTVPGGVVVADFLNYGVTTDRAIGVGDFARSVGRQVYRLDTRYGLGMIEK
jgi:hypothetical protein